MTADLTAKRGESEKAMSYRLVIRWQRTCEMDIIPFINADDAWSQICCLKFAIKNGAEVGYELQYRDENGDIEIIDCDGDPIGEWTNVRWN